MSGMPATTLVAYATSAGSTQEIAERIAAVLQQRGVDADLRRVENVADAAWYRTVVLGSPVINGSWLPEAVQFADVHQAALGARHVWLFSVGSFGDSHPLIGSLMKKEPKQIQGFLRALHPRDYRVFAGVIDRDRWSWIGGVILRLFGGHFGDNRDWSEITAWADRIAEDCIAQDGASQAAEPVQQRLAS